MMKGFIISLSLSLILLSGCWSGRELADILIGVALGIDLVDDQYQVTLQVLDPAEVAANEGTSTRSTITNYTVTADTLFEAIRQLTVTTPRKVFLSHLRLLVYGEELAREGIGDTLDFLLRDHEIRSDFVITVAKGLSAKDVLGIMSPLEKTLAEKVYTSIESSERNWASTQRVELDELMDSILSNGKEAVLTGVSVRGDIEKGKEQSSVERTSPLALVYVDSLGVLKHDQLIGWLTREESQGLNFVVDNVQNTVEHIDWPEGGTITLELIRNQTKMDVSAKDDQVKVKLSVSTIANIGDVAANVSIRDLETLSEIEKHLGDKLKDLMQSTIDVAQKEQIDIFGFGDQLRRQDPKAWTALEKNWPEAFANAEISYDMLIEIRQSGMVTDPFDREFQKKLDEKKN